MKKYFFCAKNIEDYRKMYNAAITDKKITFSNDAGEVVEEKIIDENSDASDKELFEQHLFLDQLKKMFELSDKVFDYKTFCATGIDGLRYDFNFGLRIDVPKGNFRVRIGDADSGDIFFDRRIFDGGRLLSLEQHYIRWHFEVFRDDEKIFEHTLNLAGQPVTLMIAGAMGDHIALLPFATEFQKRHRCKLTVCVQDYLKDFAEHLYPDLTLVDKTYFETYATYYPVMMLSDLSIGVGDLRNMPLERMGGAFLGLNALAPKPTFKPTAAPVTRDPYVCIAVQASGNRKCWLYDGGWDIVVDYLKTLGYRVFCIDRSPEQINDDLTIRKPDGAEDFTGDRSIMERANMLYHAEFFIGLSSGLAWLANAVDCPVVMICGFSQSWFEFYTPYRVANRLVCNGCLTDIRVNYLKRRCPRHHDTPRELECQKKIHPRQVINAINRLIVDKGLIPPAVKGN